MREIQPWDAGAGIDAAFDDVTSVTLRCKFGNCSHTVEPGCAVQAALADGPKFFAELMAAVGSRDGREIVRELEAMRRAGQLWRDAEGRYSGAALR